MELLCIQGAAPGRIVATLSHATRVRQVPMMVVRHPAGGWQIALPAGEFGPRCRSVETAILMEAGAAFDEHAAADNVAEAA